MSLINDALKQTRQIRQSGPTSGPPTLAPVESVSHGNLGWLVPGIIILLLVVAGVFIALSVLRPMTLAANTMPATNSIPAAVRVVPNQRVKLAATAPLVVSKAASRTNSISAAPPKLPDLKLQGILFSPIRPCAIVNGRTVFVGDRVNKFRVAAISRDSVELQSATETRVLSLNRQ